MKQLAKIINPLAFNVPIVDPKTGYPTEYFKRILEDISDAKISASLIEALGGDPDEDQVVTWDDTAGDLAFKPASDVLDMIGAEAHGDILHRGAAGWELLPAGTAGKVLTTHGAGADPTWETAAGGGGGAVLLSSQTVSGVPSVAFTSLISSTYTMYRLEYFNLTVATNGVNILMQVSTNNGSSYDSGANYTYAGHQANHSTFQSAGIGALNSTSYKLDHGMRNSAGDVIAGEVLMFDPSNTTGYKQFLSNSTGFAGDNNYYHRRFGGRWQNTAAYNAIQIFASSGNISGTFRLLGYS